MVSREQARALAYSAALKISAAGEGCAGRQRLSEGAVVWVRPYDGPRTRALLPAASDFHGRRLANTVPKRVPN
jgi:hypothetical protein